MLSWLADVRLVLFLVKKILAAVACKDVASWNEAATVSVAAGSDATCG